MISPVFWLMPSPKQKRQIHLRQHAMTLGLQVKITDMPQSHRQQVRKEAVSHGVLYRLPLTEINKALGSFRFLMLQGELAELSGQNLSKLELQMVEELQNLPDSILALEYSNAGLAIYWYEKGSLEWLEDLFQQMQQALKRLQLLHAALCKVG
jgi:hypothetical protein